MRTAIALLLLVGTASAQAPKIEGTARDGTVQEGGSPRPAFLCEGQTDLPEGSRLDVRVYFGEIEMGKHLFLQAIEVKDGKFSVALPVFRRQTLKGHFVLHVEFNPYLQDPAIQKKLGKQLKNYDAKIPLTVGTEREIEEDRRRVMRQLGAEVDGLRTIVEQVNAELARKPGADSWARSVKAWSEAIHDIENRCHDVPEYKALRIDDISEQSIEDLAHCVDRVIDAAGRCLSSTQDAEAVKQLQEHCKGFDWMRRPVALRLGIEKATAKELTDLLPEVQTPLLESAKLYVTIIKKPDPDQREYFKAMLKHYQAMFRERAFGLSEIAPDKHLEAVRTLIEKGNEFFRIADEAKEMKENRKNEVLDAQKAFADTLSAFQNSLKE